MRILAWKWITVGRGGRAQGARIYGLSIIETLSAGRIPRLHAGPCGTGSGSVLVVPIGVEKFLKHQPSGFGPLPSLSVHAEDPEKEKGFCIRERMVCERPRKKFLGQPMSSL